jgi:eukaryotic-like serine/threonine-protein kinase
VLVGALSAGPLAVVIAGVWLPAQSAVLIGLVAVVAGLVAPVADRARAQIGERARRRDDLVALTVGASDRGRLPRVRDCDDPVVLGVHPAAVLAGNDRVPPFVARDIDEHLSRALERSGLVLIVGESTAGKSRIAYEVMRSVLAEHVLVVPAGTDVIETLATTVVDLPRCLLWLDDLERYLGPGGLSSSLLNRMLGDGSRHVVVLATMRTVEHARYNRIREAGLDDAGRQVWRRGRDVIEQAHEFTLDRRWSATEVGRAQGFIDRRIIDAVGHADRFGVAEVLAAGPELLTTLRNAWTPGCNPRGAALVMAAVACRRAGVHRAVSRRVLEDLHVVHLATRGGAELRPEPMDAALEFATSPVYATTSLLLPDERGGYLAHDYLVDADLPARIDGVTWETLLSDVTAAEAYEVGIAAYDANAFGPARTAFDRAAAAGIPNATYMHAVVIGTAGRPAEAVGILQTLLAAQNVTIGADNPDTLATRFKLALFTDEAGRLDAAADAFQRLLEDRVRIYGRDDADALVIRRRLAALVGMRDPAAALADLRFVLADCLRVLGPDHPDTLRCRAMVAVWTCNAGDDVAGIDALRTVVADQARILGHNHLDTLRNRGNLACHIGRVGEVAVAVSTLGNLVVDCERVLGPDHPYTLECRHDHGMFTGRVGDYRTAVTELRNVLADATRVLGSDHPDTLETRHSLGDAIGHAGDPRHAVDILGDVFIDRQRVLGPDDPHTLQTQTTAQKWARQVG